MIRKLKLKRVHVDLNNISTIKNSFIQQVRFDRTFKGKKILFANQHISNDECWEKFSVGGKKHHGNKKTLDWDKISKLSWIFSILKLMDTHEYNIAKIGATITKSTSHTGQHRSEYYFEHINYLIVIQDNTNQIENPHYCVVSAYSPKNKKRTT